MDIQNVGRQPGILVFLWISTILLSGCSAGTTVTNGPGSGPVVLQEIKTELKTLPTPEPFPEIGQPPESKYENVIVRTFYATNRNATGSTSPHDAYGTTESVLSYGVADVSIPRDHRLGEMEESYLGKAFENEKNSLMLMGVQAATREQLLSAIRENMKAHKGRNVLVFIHGYNVEFEDAARRTAQLSYDLGFDGAPIFFSWPSQAKLAGYWKDEEVIKITTPKIKSFLSDVFKETDAENVYLVAHSMGNRGMTEAITQLMRDDAAIRPKLKQLVLAAPDIGVKDFATISAALVEAGAPVTIYASSKDLALRFSKVIHTMATVGNGGQFVTVVKGIDTIDASDVSSDFLGHSYFAENGSVVSDMFYLFKTELRPVHRFNMASVSNVSGDYWKFKPGLCKP